VLEKISYNPLSEIFPDFVDLRLEKVGALNHLAHSINAIVDRYPSCKANALESIEDSIVIIEPFANNAVFKEGDVSSRSTFLCT
jgi:hypothetical protein